MRQIKITTFTYFKKAKEFVRFEFTISLFFLMPIVLFSQGKDIIRYRVIISGDNTKYYFTESYEIKKMDNMGELVRVGGIYSCTCPEFDRRVDFGGKIYFLLKNRIVTSDNQEIGYLAPYKNVGGIWLGKDEGNSTKPVLQNEVSPPRKIPFIDDYIP